MLTRLAFRYRPVTLLLTGLLLALGIVGLFVMPRREDPDLKGRFAQVIALYPGASAAQVEELVTDPLERTIREVEDAGTVTSTSRAGIAVIQVEASDRMTDTLDKLMDDLRKRVDDTRPSLPSGVLSVSVNDRFTDTSALIVGVTRPGASARELEDMAKRVRDRLHQLPEVGEATLLGEQQEVITVALSSVRLAAYNGAITLDDISSALARRNVLPENGGSVASGDARLTIAPAGELHTPEEIGGVIVGASQAGGSPVYLRDVATITRGYADPPASLMRVDGQPSVGVTLTQRKGQNITTLGASAGAALEELRAEMPSGTELRVVNDLPRSVAHRVGGFFHELQMGVLIILAVMFLFMGWRSALLVGAMLPISMLGTFGVMWIAGLDIQQMSIAALIIALALVVDNSIVVLDNIDEKLTEGLSRDEAAIAGASELTAPMVTSNMVAALSFLPLAFLPGGVGDFIRDLGRVTALALSVSLLLNLTVMPLLCWRFLRGGQERRTRLQRWMDRGIDSLRDGKAALAAAAFRRPGVVVGIAAFALLGAISLIPRLGLQFFPSAERDQFAIDIWLPEGRDILTTSRATATVERIVQAQPGVRSLVTYIGAGGPRFYYNVSPEPPAANYAQIVVNTAAIEDTDRIIPAVQRAVDAALPDVRVTVKSLEQGPPVGAPVAIRVSGREVSALRMAAAQIRGLLNETPGAQSVYDSYGELPLALRVDVDEDRAARMGLSSGAVAQTAHLAFSGQTATLLREGDKEIPVDLRLDRTERSGAADLADLYLPSPYGPVPLRQVASLKLEPEGGRIVRRDGERTVTVYAYGDGSRLPSAILADVKARLASQSLPPGCRVSYGGEQEETNKSFVNMTVVFAVALVFNVVILVVQFNSFPLVFAVMSAVPLGVIGAAPGLYLARQHFGFMAFLGIAALGGIVTNHTIFLFHYALEERRLTGVSMAEALVDASRRRLRPILLTVLLSVGALLPQAFSGSKLWPPLDWAIIAGLLVSTFLSMIVVPSVYALLTRGRAAERESPVPMGSGLVPES